MIWKRFNPGIKKIKFLCSGSQYFFKHCRNLLLQVDMSHIVTVIIIIFFLPNAAIVKERVYSITSKTVFFTIVFKNKPFKYLWNELYFCFNSKPWIVAYCTSMPFCSRDIQTCQIQYVNEITSIYNISWLTNHLNSLRNHGHLWLYSTRSPKTLHTATNSPCSLMIFIILSCFTINRSRTMKSLGLRPYKFRDPW